MADKPKRVYARFDCDIPVEVWDASRKLGAGKLVDIGVGGAFLVTALELAPGAGFRLRFIWESLEWRIEFRVVREAPKDIKEPRFRHYGLEFILTPAQEAKLKTLIDTLRRSKKDGPMGEKLKWYWGL